MACCRHGGGWIYGDKEIYEIPIGDVSALRLGQQGEGMIDIMIKQLAIRARAAIVFVEYSLTPEVQYPVALDQVWAAIRWVQQSSDLIHVDPSTLIVAGDSAGGNLAAATCCKMKETPSP